MVAEWRLTPREYEVVTQVATGLSNRQIARTLGISEKTVKNHLSSTYLKLGAHSRVEATLLILRHRAQSA